MGGSILFRPAVRLIIGSTGAFGSGHPLWAAWEARAAWPAWSVFTGVAILLLLGTIVAVALAVRSRSENGAAPKQQGPGGAKPPSQKISNSLVTLSAAAILAIYAAGYHRTGSAAYKLEVEEARRRAAARIAAIAQAQTVSIPQIEPAPVIQPPVAPPPARKKAGPSPGKARKSAPATLPPSSDSTTASGETATAPAGASDAKPQVHYKDGTFLGWGYSRHGNIQASVMIQDGKIASTAIVQCLTRYSCSWIADLPDQAVTRQSENVDFVSGATESSEAFSDAIAAALSKASE